MVNKTILIADDDQAVVRILSLRLRNLGLEPKMAFDAKQALTIAHNEPPAAIIMDVAMPAGDGLSVCEVLAQDEQLKSIPVVVLTSNNRPATLERCRSLGVPHVHKDPNYWTNLKPILVEWLGLEDHAHVDADPIISDPLAERPQPPSRPRPLLMIIDDDPWLVELLSKYAKKHDIDVVASHSGQKGYWKALKAQPDIIVLDYQMPGGYGNFVLGRLKSHPITRHTPTIVLTSKQDDALRDQLLELGADAFLNKPCPVPRLIKKLREYLPSHTAA